MMKKVELRDGAIEYNNLVSLETYLIVLRNKLLRSMTIHNLVPLFLIGEESHFLDETTEVTVNICQVTFAPFMMRRWETSPILLLDRSLWINRKEGMTRVPSVYDQCDPQAIHYADAEAVDD
jgi:hypothetical protein